MDNRHEEHMYTYRRVKLSSLYKEIGEFLKEHGDADVRSMQQARVNCMILFERELYSGVWMVNSHLKQLVLSF